MYCRNCGAEMNDGADICLKCGFAKGKGANTHCPNCGAEVLPEQSLCVKCGYLLENERKSSKKKDEKSNLRGEYQAYIPNVKKSSMLEIIRIVIAIFIMISIVFLPIYKCNYEPTKIEEITDTEVLKVYLETGSIPKNFSLFDDVSIIMGTMFSSENLEPLDYAAIMYNMFSICTFICGIIYMGVFAYQLYGAVKSYQNIDETTMLEYTKFKKMGSGGKEEKIKKRLKDQGVSLTVSLAVYDLIFAWFFSKLMHGIGSDMMSKRYMSNLSGVSWMFIFLCILIAGYIVSKILIKNEEKQMLITITNEEYQ